MTSSRTDRYHNARGGASSLSTCHLAVPTNSPRQPRVAGVWRGLAQVGECGKDMHPAEIAQMPIEMNRSRTTVCLLAVVALALALVGCGAAGSPLPSVQSLRQEVRPPPTPAQSAQNLEPMLEAAGFIKLAADTPEREQRLASMEPLKLNYFVGKTGKLHYWFADPEVCHCLFHGDDQAYQRYEQMKAENRIGITPQRARTYQDEELNMQMEQFNPYGMGTNSTGVLF